MTDSFRGTGRTHRQMEAVAVLALKGGHEVYVVSHPGLVEYCVDMLIGIVPPSTDAKLIHGKRKVTFGRSGSVTFLAVHPGEMRHRLAGCRNVTIDHAVHDLKHLTESDRQAIARHTGEATPVTDHVYAAFRFLRGKDVSAERLAEVYGLYLKGDPNEPPQFRVKGKP